jgi:hypothetical protein
LEASFQRTHYPDVNAVDRLAEFLNLSTERISIWFQNRRARYKRARKEPSNSSIATTVDKDTEISESCEGAEEASSLGKVEKKSNQARAVRNQTSRLANTIEKAIEERSSDEDESSALSFNESAHITYQQLQAHEFQPSMFQNQNSYFFSPLNAMPLHHSVQNSLFQHSPSFQSIQSQFQMPMPTTVPALAMKTNESMNAVAATPISKMLHPAPTSASSVSSASIYQYSPSSASSISESTSASASASASPQSAKKNEASSYLAQQQIVYPNQKFTNMQANYANNFTSSSLLHSALPYDQANNFYKSNRLSYSSLFQPYIDYGLGQNYTQAFSGGSLYKS